MSTLEDVAKRANVSIMTVSRVINDSGPVSQATRKRVLDVIDELGYRTNLLARSFSLGRSDILAYIVPDISDAYFSAVLKGAENACRKYGQVPIFFSARTSQDLKQALQLSIDYRVGGVVLHDLNPSQEDLELLRKHNIARVLVDCEAYIHQENTIDILHEQGARAVAEVFLRQGYERICCVHGPMEASGEEDHTVRRGTQYRLWTERTRGFCETLREKNVEPKLYQFDTNLENAYDAGQQVAKKILEEAQWPIAVYCEEDTLALGVSGYMQEHGILTPEQIAIFGNDGLDISTTLYPRISTVLHPRQEMGSMAIDMLQNLLQNGPQVEHRQIESTVFFGDTTLPEDKTV